MKKALITLAVCYLSMIAIIDLAYASDTNQCDMQLSSAIRITADSIEVTDASGALMQVLSKDQLTIAGKPVSLTDAQRHLLVAYNEQVRETVPAVVDIALEGIDLGLTAASEVFRSLFDAQPPTSLTRALAKIKARVDQQVRRGDNNIYLDARGLSDFDSVMEQLEPEIEAVMTASLGEVFSDLGNSLQAEDASIIESVANLVARMDGFAEKLEARLHQQAKTLKSKADSLCQQLQDLQIAELQLQRAIPAAKPFDLIEPQANLL
jgi:DNA anti-recombination protein RmuC